MGGAGHEGAVVEWGQQGMRGRGWDGMGPSQSHKMHGLVMRCMA